MSEPYFGNEPQQGATNGSRIGSGERAKAASAPKVSANLSQAQRAREVLRTCHVPAQTDLASQTLANPSEMTRLLLKLLTVSGGLAAVEWSVVEAQHAALGPWPLGDPEVYEAMLRLQAALASGQGICLGIVNARGGR